MRTAQEGIDKITDNPALAAAFAAQCFDHGGSPSQARFAMHALIPTSCSQIGAWYPVGGAAALVEHILPTITACGGEARADARVERLPLEDDRVVVVRTAEDEDFRAETVISEIEARSTDWTSPQSVRYGNP